MKILILLAKDTTYRYRQFLYNKTMYGPANLAILAGRVPSELRAEITLIDEGVQYLDYSQHHFDVVGITFAASAAYRAYELGDYFRGRGSHVVFGGAHATLNPQEASAHADVVVVGPGEEAWPRVLRAYAAGDTLDPIVVVPVPRTLSSGIPRIDLVPRDRYVFRPSVVASRGCPYACTYCSIQKQWGRKAVTRPVEEVIEEIRRWNTRGVQFLDPNIAGDRAYALALFEALIPLKIRWSGLANIDWSEDRELFGLAVRSGCDTILHGFESISQASLNQSLKRFSQVKLYKQAVARLHANDVGVIGCMVLGFDSDTQESLARTSDYIAEVGVDLTKFGILTPYPGTDVFHHFKDEGRIIDWNWSHYDQEHVVFQPQHLTPRQLHEAFVQVWREHHTFRKVLRRARSSVRTRILSNLGANLAFKYHFPTQKHWSSPPRYSE